VDRGVIESQYNSKKYLKENANSTLQFSCLSTTLQRWEFPDRESEVIKKSRAFDTRKTDVLLDVGP